MLDATCSSYTTSGHLIGMLDRDLRTTKSSVRHLEGVPSRPSSDSCCDPIRTSHFVCQRPQPARSYNKRKSLQRFKQVLVVSTYLLIFLPNAALAAPAPKTMGNKYTDSYEEWSSPEKWILERNFTQTVVNVTDEERAHIARMVRKQATTAFHKATSHLEQYTQDQFGMSSSVVNRLYGEQQFDWLPGPEKVPKKFGEDVTDSIDLEMGEALITLYEQFQKVAVGLEQIVWDRRVLGLDEKAFADMEDDLRAVLGELQIGIKMLGRSALEDVRRTHMPEAIRDVNETDRRVRDWIIYRDYINLLEYTMQVFGRFQSMDTTSE